MYKKKAGRWCIFLCVTLIMILTLSEAMKGNELTAVCNIKSFYREEKNSLDAVVIGASEVYTSYSGIKAWEEFGYTSYAYGCPGLSGSLYKTVLEEVLTYQSPQAIVIEINGFIHGDNYLFQEGRFRNLVDNLRWSGNRWSTIQEQIPEEERMSYYFPLMAYHSNWKNPGSMLRNMAAKILIGTHSGSVMKGYAGVSRKVNFKRREHKGSYKFGEESEQALTELLEYCREQGLEHVLFFRSPHRNIPDQEEELDRVWDLIDSYGYDHLDLSRNLKKNGISVHTDFYNAEHLNIYGMEKVTNILGNYLMEEYQLCTLHPRKTNQRWNACAEKADRVFAAMEQDIQNDIPRHYSELNVYIKTRALKNDELEE